MLVTKQLLVAIDLRSMEKNTMEVNAHILQNILFCVQQRKGILNGLQ